MVYRKISTDMKKRALQMLDEGWDVGEIVDALSVSKDSILRWQDKYDTYSCVNPSPVLQGRRRRLNAAAIEDLHELIQESPSLFLDEVAEWLALYHDQPISTTALHDNLRDLGLTYKKLRRVAAERDDAYRAAWMHDVLTNYTADQMVLLDESSKDGHTLFRQYGRAPIGETPQESMVHDRGIRYSILPALTLDGYIAIHVVEGSIDGEEFFDFVLNDVVSSRPCSCRINMLLTSFSAPKDEPLPWTMQYDYPG
jgi:transposase